MSYYKALDHELQDRLTLVLNLLRAGQGLGEVGDRARERELTREAANFVAELVTFGVRSPEPSLVSESVDLPYKVAVKQNSWDVVWRGRVVVKGESHAVASQVVNYWDNPPPGEIGSIIRGIKRDTP